MLRPTPGDPWGVEQHHWNAGAEEVKNGKKVIKNNFRILKKQYAYLQTILKTPVKFQKDWPKTVGGVADKRMVVGADGRTDGQTDRRTDGHSKFRRV